MTILPFVNGLLGKIGNSRPGDLMKENLRIQGDPLRNERENFGVQQPAYTMICIICMQCFQGSRRVNKKMSEVEFCSFD